MHGVDIEAMDVRRMLNVVQFIIGEESVVDEDFGKARDSVRAHMAIFGGERAPRIRRPGADTGEPQFKNSPPRTAGRASANVGRPAGETQWKRGKPSEPHKAPKPMPNYVQEQEGANPFPGLGPPVG